MPLLQVRECPEDIYRKISYVVKAENRTIVSQVYGCIPITIKRTAQVCMSECVII